MGVPDLAAFPVRARGVAFEDFAEGQRFEHHWGRTVTEADAAVFTASTCAWNALYLNAEFARDEGHPCCPVPPMLVVCIVVGLSVEDLSEEGGPFLGIDACELLAPVYPGDTLTSSSTVRSTRRSASRPDAGIVTWVTEGRNQHDEVVLRLERTNLLARRATP